jgi:hypothetical protein
MVEMFANAGNPDSTEEKAVPKWQQKTLALDRHQIRCT